ncbi:hypothetical protein INS49_004452 [Diaporthe citri]|uniref:uncharacterized protein n=1 Tax=Diaporthe citri TaxID=83186 RepID=UPI001C7F84D1|nr:uncharacterized protein INS49_004452 [Diaporthe citri]KAG6354435.1 hypothetical protein INS49_004452 [Diaporthe citri]
MRPDAAFGFVAASALTDFTSSNQYPFRPSPATICCHALSERGLAVSYPDSPTYNERTQSYWSVAAQLTPWCIVQPSDTHEVALSLKVLLADPECGIAVRSGGHTTFAGASNIEDGVTIDLGNMNNTVYHPENSTASLQPGARWLQVYQTLDALGVTVPGGRAGTVGVAGLILGGGNSFYSAKTGMVCDSVVGYEMVTYTGDVIYVTNDTYPDLFKALKGGGSNFGIVTKFNMIAFESPRLWGGAVTYNKTAGPELLESMVDFTENIEKDQASSSIIFWTFQPALQDTIIVAAYENTDGVVAGRSFDKYLAIPENLTSTMRETNISDITHELEQPAGYIDIWFTLSFKNDQRVLVHAVSTHNQLVEDMLAQSPDGDFITQCMFQPLPTIFAKHGTARGGNVLGLDRLTDNAVLWLATLAVKGADQEEFGRAKMVAWVKNVQDYAKSVGAHVEWRYLNYADYTQDPLGSYGAENVEFIREVAAKYDPEGVFQSKIPGGFKISKSS